MPLSEQQIKFCKTHLGVGPSIDSSADNFATKWSVACDGWGRAVETVDTQIGKLQSALKKHDDAELAEIAEYGLNAITGNHKVRIMAAINDLTAAGTEPEDVQIKAITKRIEAFLDHLATDPRVKATDSNPFGVPMSVANTMTAALQDLRRALLAVN